MHILDILLPRFCLGCGRIGTYLCFRCTKKLHPILSSETICPMCEHAAIDGRTHPRCQTKTALDGLVSFYRYDGVVKKAVKEIKYRFAFSIVDTFINQIREEQLDLLNTLITKENWAIIPVPLHPKRYRFRGFNQAEIMGLQLGKRLHIPLRRDVLKRVVYTTPQVEMEDKAMRLTNMRGVFGLQRDCRRESFLLIDDVFTTGATMREAAKVLKRGGATAVWAVTIAR